MANVKTATATATNAKQANSAALYKHYLAGWPAAKVGPKPSQAEFDLAHTLGAKPGTTYAMAWAMYMRPQGATRGEVSAICGGPQYNKADRAVSVGQATWRDVTPRGPSGKHKVYKLALPVKKAKAKPASKAKAQAKPETATPKLKSVDQAMRDGVTVSIHNPEKPSAS